MQDIVELKLESEAEGKLVYTLTLGPASGLVLPDPSEQRKSTQVTSGRKDKTPKHVPSSGRVCTFVTGQSKHGAALPVNTHADQTDAGSSVRRRVSHKRTGGLNVCDYQKYRAFPDGDQAKDSDDDEYEWIEEY